MNYFHQLNPAKIKGKLIFLDIDGTLTYNAQPQVEEEVIKMVDALKKNNRVMLCSNRNDHARNRKVAKQVKADYLETNIRKPSKRILNQVEKNGEPMLVIGDKFLTDGLFAKRIGAEFIKVKRIAGTKDSLACKLTYVLDDFCAKLFTR